LQRFSEDHYRVKEGRFTNCDAQKGETPAWRFEFKDLDLRAGDNVAFTGAWLCVNDVPLIPIPTMTYPLTKRRTGFLIPTVGWDSRFGIHLQESFFWAINPSQDLTVSPFYYSKLGYGSEFKYRYVLDRQSRGQWYINALQETETPNLSGVSQGGQSTSQARALIRGTHTQQFTPDLLLRVQANLVTDSSYLQQLSNSGAQRALPSAESNLFLNRRLSYGNTYLLGQYLQPLQSGGVDTFQRLPEIGYNLPNLPLFSSPVLLGAETTYVYFYREQGFDQNRVDILPGLSTDVLNFGHIVGLTPQVKVREVYYTHGAQTSENQNRETFWAGLDATSKLSRRYRTSEGNTLLHTVEPSVTYEYVPSTNQSQLTLIDQVDSLPYKNLMTYAIRSRLLEQTGSSSFNWLDFTMAQSYHMGAVQTSAANFTWRPSADRDPDATAAAGDGARRREEIFRPLAEGRDRQYSPKVYTSPANGWLVWLRRRACAQSAACYEPVSDHRRIFRSLPIVCEPIQHRLQGSAVQLLVSPSGAALHAGW
jgi:LPS-assembly protein